MFDHNFINIFAIIWIQPIPINKSNSFFIWSPTSNKSALNTIPGLLPWYSNQLATGYFMKLHNLSELRWLFVLPAFASERIVHMVLLLGWAQTYWLESFALFKTLSWLTVSSASTLGSHTSLNTLQKTSWGATLKTSLRWTLPGTPAKGKKPNKHGSVSWIRDGRN